MLSKLSFSTPELGEPRDGDGVGLTEGAAVGVCVGVLLTKPTNPSEMSEMGTPAVFAYVAAIFDNEEDALKLVAFTPFASNEL